MREGYGPTLMIYMKNDKMEQIYKLRKAMQMNHLRNKLKKNVAIARQNKMKKTLENPKKIRAAAQGAIARQQKLARAR